MLRRTPSGDHEVEANKRNRFPSPSMLLPSKAARYRRSSLESLKSPSPGSFSTPQSPVERMQHAVAGGLSALGDRLRSTFSPGSMMYKTRDLDDDPESAPATRENTVEDVTKRESTSDALLPYPTAFMLVDDSLLPRIPSPIPAPIPVPMPADRLDDQADITPAASDDDSDQTVTPLVTNRWLGLEALGAAEHLDLDSGYFGAPPSLETAQSSQTTHSTLSSATQTSYDCDDEDGGEIESELCVSATKTLPIVPLQRSSAAPSPTPFLPQFTRAAASPNPFGPKFERTETITTEGGIVTHFYNMKREFIDTDPLDQPFTFPRPMPQPYNRGVRVFSLYGLEFNSAHGSPNRVDFMRKHGYGIGEHPISKSPVWVNLMSRTIGDLLAVDTEKLAQDVSRMTISELAARSGSATGKAKLRS